MSQQKVIYEFLLPFETEVEKTEVSEDEFGTEVKTIKKVKETIQRKFAIVRPSRAERDDLEEYRVIQESEYIRKGVLPYDILFKKVVDDGGVVTEEEKQERVKLIEKFLKLQSDYTDLYNIKDEDKTEEQKNKVKELEDELTTIITRIQEIDNVGSTIFEKSADGLARNKTIFRFMLYFLNEIVNDKFVPFFKGKTFAEKLTEFDSLEERNIDFELSLIKKAMLVSGAYYMGRAATKQDFDLLIASAESKNLLGIA